MFRFLCLMLCAIWILLPRTPWAQSDTEGASPPPMLPPSIMPDTACALPAPLCGDITDFGAYWQSIAPEQRLSLLRGFDIGLQAAWQTSYLEGEEAGGIRAGIFDRRLSQNEIYAGIGLEFYLDYFNKLYADAKNAAIDWNYAWLLASLASQAANNTDADNHDEVFLKQFLQTYGELPGWVRMVEVLSPDTIEVEVLVPEPYRLPVKLRGVSTQNAEGQSMPTEDAARAVQFMRGLATTRGYPFENCGCTEMLRPQLYYGGSLFTKDGVLQAYVRINENYICLAKSEVSIADISQSPQNLSMVLNEILLTNGLVYLDEQSNDFLESDRLLQNLDTARGAGLNIYGKKRNQAIERVITQGPKPLNQNCLP